MKRMKSMMPVFALATVVLMACQNSNQRQIQKAELILNTKDMTTYPVKNISVSINRSADEVYRFASTPANFPKWVKFINSITKEGDIWLAESNLGRLKVEFVPQNDFGVIDHLVTLPDGTTVNNHLRVIANGKGSELIFNLLWLPGRTEEEFNQDTEAVQSDLQSIKEILESE